VDSGYLVVQGNMVGVGVVGYQGKKIKKDEKKISGICIITSKNMFRNLANMSKFF
jgi:hypothetical protein